MVPTTNICGVLPVFNRGELGLPYPAALYAVEDGRLLLDYALDQLARAGLDQVFIPLATRDIEWFARLIGYQRRGLYITYVEVPPGESHNFYAYVTRGCGHAIRRADYTKYIVLNPCTRIEDPEWAKKLIQQIEPPFHLGLTDCFYLDDPTVRKLRAAGKVNGGAECLANIFGTRYCHEPPAQYLGTWEGVRAFR